MKEARGEVGVEGNASDEVGDCNVDEAGVDDVVENDALKFGLLGDKGVIAPEERVGDCGGQWQRVARSVVVCLIGYKGEPEGRV